MITRNSTKEGTIDTSQAFSLQYSLLNPLKYQNMEEYLKMIISNLTQIFNLPTYLQSTRCILYYLERLEQL
jgi:hypothetical protein